MNLPVCVPWASPPALSFPVCKEKVLDSAVFSLASTKSSDHRSCLLGPSQRVCGVKEKLSGEEQKGAAQLLKPFGGAEFSIISSSPKLSNGSVDLFSLWTDTQKVYQFHFFLAGRIPLHLPPPPSWTGYPQAAAGRRPGHSSIPGSLELLMFLRSSTLVGHVLQEHPRKRCVGWGGFFVKLPMSQNVVLLPLLSIFSLASVHFQAGGIFPQNFGELSQSFPAAAIKSTAVLVSSECSSFYWYLTFFF